MDYLQILFENERYLCVKKPAGVPSQPDPSGQEDLLTALGKQYAGQKGVCVTLVHRLDTPTGGVMTFAKSAAAAGALSHLLADHDVFVKEYLCVLPKVPDFAPGTLEDWLYHDTAKNKSFVVDKARGGAKRALLEWEPLATAGNGFTLVHVRLRTGRTHQIRVQFACRGVPLCGDGKYGSREKCGGIALWSYRLSFPDPSSKATVTAACLPDAGRLPWSLFADELQRL